MRQNPKDAQAHNNLGTALGAVGKFREAIVHFKQALEAQPDYASARRNLSGALAAAEQNEATIRQYEEAAKANPDSTPALSQWANALMNADRGWEAIAPFERVVQLNPDNVGAHNNLAWLLATKSQGRDGDRAKAVTLAQRACQLTDQKSPDCLDTLAVAYAAAGQFPEAIAAAEKAIQLANAAKQESLAKRVEGRLELYRAGRAYGDPAPSASPPAGD